MLRCGGKSEQRIESFSYRPSLAGLRNRKKVFQDEVGGLGRGWDLHLVDLSKECKLFFYSVIL